MFIFEKEGRKGLVKILVGRETQKGMERSEGTKKGPHTVFMAVGGAWYTSVCVCVRTCVLCMSTEVRGPCTTPVRSLGGVSAVTHPVSAPLLGSGATWEMGPPASCPGKSAPCVRGSWAPGITAHLSSSSLGPQECRGAVCF